MAAAGTSPPEGSQKPAMDSRPTPKPPVEASKPLLSASEMWERFARALPAGLETRTQDEQVEYFRRLYSSYQQQYSRERAKKDSEVFACIDIYRSFILTHYPPLYPELRSLKDEFFDPAFLAAARVGTPDAWRALAMRVHPGVFSFRILNKTWCRKLLEEVDNFESWAAKVGMHINRPNSMNNFGCVLDDIGFNDVLQRLTTEAISGLAQALFGDQVGAEGLDSHHGFIVEYAVHKDRSLGFHVDDSEITMNLCLGTEFVGGDLFFRGPRCPVHQQTPVKEEEKLDYKHEAGMAVLHLGRHRHGALPLLSGRRANLILWCRSSEFRRRAATQPCSPYCAHHPAHVSDLVSVPVPAGAAPAPVFDDLASTAASPGHPSSASSSASGSPVQAAATSSGYSSSSAASAAAASRVNCSSELCLPPGVPLTTTGPGIANSASGTAYNPAARGLRASTTAAVAALSHSSGAEASESDSTPTSSTSRLSEESASLMPPPRHHGRKRLLHQDLGSAAPQSKQLVACTTLDEDEDDDGGDIHHASSSTSASISSSSTSFSHDSAPFDASTAPVTATPAVSAPSSSSASRAVTRSRRSGASASSGSSH